MNNQPQNLEAISLFPQDNCQSLLVMLHGWGANSQDLAPLAQVLNIPGMGYLFPDAPFEHPQVPGGKAWYDLNTPGYQGLEQSREMLFEWLMALEEVTKIPRSQTYIAGFSQGGAMTLDVALMLPVAGLISLSGYLHYEPQPLEVSTPQILMIHGTQDAVVPLAAAQQARDKLQGIGVGVRYQELPMGHEISSDAIALLKEFISS